MPLKLHEFNETDFTGGCLAYLGKAENVAVTENLQQPHTLSFEYPMNDEKADMIQEHRIVAVEGQAYRLNDVTREYSGTRMLKAKAERIFFADARKHHIPTIGNDTDPSKSTIGVDPYVVICKAIEGTKFELIPDDELAGMGMKRIGADGVLIDFFPTDKINAYDVITSVIDTLGYGEIYVDNYRIAVVERIGEDNGVRLSLKKNLTKLSVQRATADLVTRIYPYGADDLTIINAKNEDGTKYGLPYVQSDEAKDKYGILEGYMDYSDYTDPDKIKAHAEWDLMGNGNDKRLDTPCLTITGDVVDLSKLAEFGDFYKIRLGDTVHVYEKDFVHHKRVVTMTYYPYSPKQPTVTIGMPSNTNMFYAAWQKGKLFKVIQKNTGKDNRLKTSYFTGTVNSTQNPVQSANKQLLLDGDLLYIEDDNGRRRIDMGNLKGEFVFIIYDKKGNRAVYLNEDGEAVFSGSIQTMKDCLIQGELRVGMTGSATKGITFYGDAYFPDENGNYSTPYARILPYVANNEDFKGINVTGGKLCVEGELVATKKELEFLKQQIEVLTKRLDALS